ncbi:MAG: MATE family efflux transporter [Bacilli bacterium]|jgi:Na+-driven multidrug efflux pump
MEKRSGKLTLHKFYQYLGPGILLVFSMQFGSLAASIVIGQLLGADFLTAAFLSVSIVILTEIPGLALPTGLAIVLSNLFSKRKFQESKEAFYSVVIFGFLGNLVYIPIGIFFSDGIAAFLSGNFPAYIPLIKDYISVFFYCAPFFFLSILFCNLLAADNNPHALRSLFPHLQRGTCRCGDSFLFIASKRPHPVLRGLKL